MSIDPEEERINKIFREKAFSIFDAIKFMFVGAAWVALVVTIMGFIGTCGNTCRPNNEAIDALYFISGFIILSTIIIVSQICRLNNTLKEIKKAIEDKQPVIIQKRIVAPEQDKK